MWLLQEIDVNIVIHAKLERIRMLNGCDSNFEVKLPFFKGCYKWNNNLALNTNMKALENWLITLTNNLTDKVNDESELHEKIVSLSVIIVYTSVILELIA